jgi:hypothetical protein
MSGLMNSITINSESTSFGRSTSHQDEAGLKALSKKSEITRMIPTIYSIFIKEPDQFSKCISELDIDRHWLQLAYQ